MKVLVADDEPSILRSTALLLTDLGFEAVTTSDPQAILPLLVQERPGILLQDVRMPGLDLGDLIARIREDPRTRDVPIVLFSASLDLSGLRDRLGAEEYLEKPFRPTEMLAAIDRATGGAL